MIGLFLFGFIYVCAFYAWFPDYADEYCTPVFIGIIAVWLILKFLIFFFGGRGGGGHRPPDEFDYWQDNQGFLK
jgi:hypothetical protein